MKKGIYGKIRIIFSSIILAFVFLFELYIMINDPNNYIILAGSTLLFLFTLYLLVSVIINKINYEKIQEQEHYESINKTETASYIMIRKSFSELDERLKQLEEILNPIDKVLGNSEKTIEHMFRKLLEEQRKVAKITIGRGKEASISQIDASEKLKEKVLEYEMKLESIKEEMIEKQNTILNQKIDVLYEKQNNIISHEIKKSEDSQKELITYIKQLELAIRNQILESVNKLVLNQPQVVIAPPQPILPSESDTPNNGTVAAQVTNNIVKQEDEKPPVSEIGGLNKSMSAVKSSQPEKSDPNKMMSAEDIAALLASTEEVKEEVKEEKKAPQPELSDPNKMMSAEDIAALLASTEEVKEEVKEEKKAPQPELSDPNKMMSAEDIAALIANM